MSEIITNRRQPLIVNPAEQAPLPVEDKAAKEAQEKRHAAEVESQKALSEEEMEELKTEFRDISLGRARPKKKEDKKEESKETKVVEESDKPAKEEAKAEGAETEKEDEKEEAKPAEKPKPKRKVAEAAPSVDTALKDAITHGVEKAVKPLVDQLKPAAIDEAKMDLTPRQQKMLEVTRFIESKNPDKHKGVTVKTLANFRAEKDYREAWEAKNPDQEWLADDEAHNAFYSKHPPTMSEDEFETAKEALVEDRVSKKLSKEHNERVSQFEQERKFETAKPQIERASQEAMLDFVPLAVPAFKALVEDDKGNVRITAEIVEKMKETDPEAFEILDAEGEKLRIELRELDTLTQFPGHYKFDAGMAVKTLTSGERIFPHAAIKTFVDELEAELDKMPKDKDEEDGGSLKDGKHFITHAEYAGKIKALEGEPKSAREAAMKDLERRFWWLETPAIRKAMIADRAATVEAQVKRFDARAQRLAKATNGETPEQKAEREETEAEKAEQKKQEKQEEERRNHKPPNTAIASDKVDTSKKGGPQGGISEETWLAKATGR